MSSGTLASSTGKKELSVDYGTIQVNNFAV
jgi:hypothetical protein